MPFDRPGADEQLDADLRVGVPVTGEPGDLRLLGGEVAGRLGGVLAQGFPGGQQLAPGPLGEPLDTGRGQHLVGGPELIARVHAAALAPQPLAVEQMRAGQFHADTGPAEPLDRLAVQPLGGLVIAQQRPRAGLDAERPVGAGGRGHLLQTAQGADPALGLPGPGGGLDQLDRRPGGHPQLVRVVAARLGRGQRLVVAAQAIAQHRGRPSGGGQPVPFAAGRHLRRGGRDQLAGFGRLASPGGEHQTAVRSLWIAGGPGDGLGLGDGRAGRGELAGEQLNPRVQAQRVREHGQRPGFAGQPGEPGREQIPALVVPDVAGRPARQRQPAEPLLGADVPVTEGG